MGQKTSTHDADEIMAVYDALVLAFDILDNTDAVDRRPTLKTLSQDIAELADRVKTLSVQYRRQARKLL